MLDFFSVTNDLVPDCLEIAVCCSAENVFLEGTLEDVDFQVFGRFGQVFEAVDGLVPLGEREHGHETPAVCYEKNNHLINTLSLRLL